MQYEWEMKVRFVNTFTRWEDMPIEATFSSESAAKRCVSQVKKLASVKEVRINLKGSQQGHYFKGAGW